jgi:hypothetical protein
LAALCSFAAYSRHTIVHVPLRGAVPTDEDEYVEICGGRVDLILMHHSVGPRPTRWLRLGRQSKHGIPLTVDIDEARTARDAAAWKARSTAAESRPIAPKAGARGCRPVGRGRLGCGRAGQSR